MDTPSDSQDTTIPIPALLRAARGGYSQAIRARLAEAGLDDLPRNGPFVLGGIANLGGSAFEVIEGLRITKQAASQLIDVLVLRGYVTRAPNPSDRRRMLIELTHRGREAAAAVRRGVEEVDVELADMLTPDELAGLRAGLSALAQIRDSWQPDAGPNG